MAYLPISPVNDAVFPTAYSPYKDLKLHIRLLIEQWERFYPKITYYMYDLVNKGAVDNLSGDIPSTVVDDLWGEAVPQSALVGRKWVQPHEQTPEGDALDATAASKYMDPILVNAKVEIVEKRRDLGAFGINLERDLAVAIPTAILDKCGITVKIKDYFIWDGTKYEVVDYVEDNYWKNTNVYLFIVIYAKRMSMGS